MSVIESLPCFNCVLLAWLTGFL